MVENEYYLCSECGGSFLIGDGEHKDGTFTCHRCFHQKNYIHRSDVEYLCEIAFCIGANGYKEDMDKILAEYTALDFDYECYVDFYKHVLKYADLPFPDYRTTLLEEVYELVNDKKKLLEIWDNFLQFYKK